tara:strand:- start:885 stop:1601 length:717 start_codon:yes stop_codon:yes gene_type:complete
MPKKIKALLLSAGLGTRLRPLTFETPKCLVEVNNKPILEHWLNSLEEIGCETTIVNTHHLHKKVSYFLKNRKNKKMTIREVYEEKLLGTAGTLIANKKFFKDSRIIMIHADNITNFDLSELLKADEKKPNNCLMTMLTFDTDSPQSCGIVERSKDMIIRKFHEKVENPPNNIANAAIYVFESNLLEQLSNRHSLLFDFSKDVIPLFLGKIYSYHTKKTFIDIGTYKNLEKAKLLFKTL